MSYLNSIFALAFGIVFAECAAPATELEQRATISAAVQRNFLADDFDELERISSQYRKAKSRTPSGLWKLSLFYAGIVEAIEKQTKGQDRDASFEDLEEKAKAWVGQFPDSPSGHITYSLVLIYRAWAHRGGGYASNVDAESWDPFRHYIAMARSNLENSKTAASVDPRWYETMLTIARAESWERGEFDALLNEALGREPLFYETYFSALKYLLPKWQGSIQDIEDFARASVKRTRKEEGLGIYARIYWSASQSQFKNDLFNNSLVEWPDMKQGFEDVIARYPDSWNLNNYARFACLAGDKPKAMELLQRIGSSVVAEAWVPLLLKTRCADWARGNAAIAP